MPSIRNYIKDFHNQEVDSSLASIISELEQEGLSVEFGKIGVRTTYALIYDDSHDIELVGYTFLKDMKYYKENVGRLKALQQAIARKKVSEQDS